MTLHTPTKTNVVLWLIVGKPFTSARSIVINQKLPITNREAVGLNTWCPRPDILPTVSGRKSIINGSPARAKRVQVRPAVEAHPCGKNHNLYSQSYSKWTGGCDGMGLCVTRNTFIFIMCEFRKFVVLLWYIGYNQTGTYILDGWMGEHFDQNIIYCMRREVVLFFSR